MGALDGLKTRFGFGAGWEDEYLNEDISADVSEDDSPQEESLSTAGATVAEAEERAQDRFYSYESPYASGAAPSAVTKHVRRPDLQRASAASGSALRDLPETKPVLQAQVDDGVFRMRPKSFSEASIMADRFKSGYPVALDLALLASATRQRFIDFIAGLVYALDGNLARTSNHSYVLTPRSIERGKRD